MKKKDWIDLFLIVLFVGFIGGLLFVQCTTVHPKCWLAEDPYLCDAVREINEEDADG